MANHSTGFLKIVDAARSRVTECNVHDVKAWQDAGEAFRLIDVREESEWANGHLPNAEHLGKGIIERDIEQQVPNQEEKIVLYCGGGYRSALAGDNLQKMGYRNVISMDGGYKGWKAAGFEIS
jgi:rhodanese-related sulfurtransferase